MPPQRRRWPLWLTGLLTANPIQQGFAAPAISKKLTAGAWASIVRFIWRGVKLPYLA